MADTARFAGRVVLITGGASGIGARMAERFAGEGARVAIVDRDGDGASRVAAGLDGAVAVAADISTRQAVRTALAAVRSRLGPVSVLVNNAASCTDRPFSELSDEEWERDLAVDLGAPFRLIQEALPDLARHRGVVLNIASVNALAHFGNEAYSAAKAGLLALTRSLAVSYGRQGVRVVAIAPGTIVTPAWDERVERDPAVLDNVRRWYPLGRLGTADDIAEAALFLCSDAASWITGTALVVDGGLMSGNAVMTSDIVGRE